jgi:hypothetical protein
MDPATGMMARPGTSDSPAAPNPVANNNAMGETGVDDNTSARHVGIVQDHKSAANFEKSRAVPGDQSGAGMVIGQQSPLVLGGGDGGHGDQDADTPGQGPAVKTIAGSDGFRTSSDGDSGPQTGAGKTLL